MRGRRSGFDAGALIFGALLLFVGGYYLFRNTLGFALPELDSDKVWPVVVIAIGLAFVLRSSFRTRPGSVDEPPH